MNATAADAPALISVEVAYAAAPHQVECVALRLPAGATAVDFAYHLHSDLGHRCRGAKVDGLVHAITFIAEQFDPTFDARTIELRESKGGNYLGVTISVTATSREQLDELYRTLTSHPLVKVVL